MTGNRKILAAAAAIAVIVFVFIKMAEIRDPEVSSFRILDRNGMLLREVCSTKNGTAYPVKLETLPAYLLTVVINTEDKRFYSHIGIDPLAIARALRQDVKAKKIVSGGSTITQQLVRSTGNYRRDIFSKVFVALKALCVERTHSKKQILEDYLNRIPYGNGAYGIEAASRLYFAKPSGGLTLAQAAFLTAIPGATRIYDPYRSFDAAKDRQKMILSRLAANKKITQQEYNMACIEKINIYTRDNRFLAPHFCDYIISRYAQGARKVLQTTLDIAVQHETEQVITNVLTKIKSANVTNAAAVVIDNETGEVLAMTGSADYYNEKNDGQVNGAVSLRQPGSTVKPFVYGLALENGMRASDILPDIDTHVRVIGGGDFIPENYDKKFHGPVRMRTALACSYNVATVNLAARFGPEMILTKLRQAGLTSMTRDARFYGPGICLGTGEVTLLELTRAFSCFAHEGMLKDYRLLEDEPRREMGQVFSPQVAYIITEILSDNQARQPAFGEFSPLRMPFKCMAKTGTSKNFRDNWAIGCTPRYTVGVWAGNFNARAMYSVSGISGSAPIFRDIMLYLERGNTCRDFKRPEWIVKRTICVNSGKIPTKYCNETMEEYFIKGSEPDMVCDVHRHFRIDTRNGLLASSDCPDELVVDKVFEVYPPEFYNWSRDTGNEPPPGRVSDYNSGNSVMSEISYPKDGDVFKIDAVLRKDYQVVVCKPKIYARADRVMWYVDGKKAFTASYPYHFSWKITVGQHEIYMIAHDDKSGQDYKSTVINIRVI